MHTRWPAVMALREHATDHEPCPLLSPTLSLQQHPLEIKEPSPVTCDSSSTPMPAAFAPDSSAQSQRPHPIATWIRAHTRPHAASHVFVYLTPRQGESAFGCKEPIGAGPAGAVHRHASQGSSPLTVGSPAHPEGALQLSETDSNLVPYSWHHYAPVRRHLAAATYHNAGRSQGDISFHRPSYQGSAPSRMSSV